MSYHGVICGVVEERFTYKLPVAKGCPYNKCAFCDFYKHMTYREIPLEDIEAELARVSNAGGKPERIMLGDGNPLWLPFDRLKKIVEMIEHYLPSCTTLCSDASVLAIESKTDDELAWLARHGYRMAYVGIESGLDDVLEFMDKDHLNDQAREQIARLHKAGIDFGAHIITGAAGNGRGIENARATAALINELRPVHICDFSLYVASVTELGLKEEDGEFVRASMLENMREMREFVSLLDEDLDLFFEGYFSAFLRKPEGKGVGPGSKVIVNTAGEFVRKSLLLKGDLRTERENILAGLDGYIKSTEEFESGLEPATEQGVA
ncbi:coproporphyrinogen III oxidase [Slackia heliotrinireducens]|uniref:Fe-S oxidoreductase n=1 Tax=Slackia heliotrinireducens (strain ATCC 29202 / DSM 20476 / NCTC 11029 / RHS 1) TaxID=471855 RepID=C7N0R2_SLAHD|nr:radical SAM protein [Slackia heliotrinireducens]ACV21140.1 Fe-S oxidoreductase [Slackia heliotrinireducens DSM 20476]VEH03830.1 coproporphyrinogen III oxidase [Slackia heliotrinireducens]